MLVPDTIKQCPVFAGLDDNELQLILSRMRERKVMAGDGMAIWLKQKKSRPRHCWVYPGGTTEKLPDNLPQPQITLMAPAHHQTRSVSKQCSMDSPETAHRTMF